MGFLQEFREIDFFTLAVALLASSALYYDQVFSFLAQASARMQANWDIGNPLLLFAGVAAIIALGSGFSIWSAVYSKKPANYQVWLMFLAALVGLIPLSLISLAYLGADAAINQNLESAALMAIPLVTLIRCWALVSGFLFQGYSGRFDFESNANAIRAFPVAAMVLGIGFAVRLLLPAQLPLACLATYQCASYASSMIMLERPMRKEAGKPRKKRRK